jgi:amidase
MVFGAPLGMSFFGTAFSEPTLIKLASGFEAATQVRAHNLPTFADTVPDRHIQGTKLHPPHRHNTVPVVPVKPQDPKKKIPHNI